MHTVTKSYRDFPAAHRQPNHQGHCRLIHGHNWGWDITFSCASLDGNGFVIDVGELGVIKSFLTDCFDHTLLLNEGDPALSLFKEALGSTVAASLGGESYLKDIFANIITVPNCGMEGLAAFVYKEVNLILDDFEEACDRGVRVVEVTCWEDSKNRATYREC